MEVLQDKQILAVQQEAGDIVTRAENFQIVSEETATDANNILHWIAGKKKVIEERKKFFVTPLKDHVKRIEAELKLVTGPLLQADAIIRSKVVDYRIALEEAARKEEERLRRKAEAKQKKQEEKALIKGETPPPPPPTPTIEVLKTTEGVTMVKTWTYGVQDMTKVPLEYLMLDTGEVMRAIRQGVREIPGLRIYQKETVKVGG